MAIINVHLRDGFSNDAAIVRIGEHTERRDGLKTRMQIGRAAYFTVDAPAGPTEINVQIPTRNLETVVSVHVPTTGELYVGISIENGTLTSTVSDTPFHYA